MNPPWSFFFTGITPGVVVRLKITLVREVLNTSPARLFALQVASAGWNGVECDPLLFFSTGIFIGMGDS
jgi:hypothetical protein